jgi:hypothetical protein
MERLYLRFFRVLPIHSVSSDDDLNLLNADELALVRQTERWAMAAAVLLELVSSLVIFGPIHAFPEIFEARSLNLGGLLTGFDTPIPLARLAWMMLVTLVELFLLLLINLAAVHGIAVATGYIRRDNKAAHADGLIEIALERHSKGQKELGIDPFDGMQRWVLFLFVLLNRLKAAIANALIRAAITNLFGREILRAYLDFAGVPVYMAMNLYTTRELLRRARVIIMGQTSIDLLLRRTPRLPLDAAERGLLYDALQYIAVSKRDFHANHLHLTQAVIKHFGIPVETLHSLPKNFLGKLERARTPVANVCRTIIVLGFVLDGRISWRERRELRRLRALGLLDLSDRDLEAYLRDFVDGQGLARLEERYLASTPGAAAPAD